MAGMKYIWPAESFDAIGVRARDVNITVRGTEGDEIRLECDGDEKHVTRLTVDHLGCWLWISTPTSGKSIQLILMLPKQKTWPIDLYARNVNFRAEDIRARINLVFAKGEVQLSDCQGAINMASGNVDINLKHFIEEEVPEMPSLPDSESKKRQKSPGINMPMTWGKEDWAQWGLDLSEKMVKGFLGQKGGSGQQRGINIRAAKGDFQIEDTDAETCIIKVARSDAKLKTVRISKLDLNVIRGDIQIDSGIPGKEWKIKTQSGEIALTLPSDINARIDAATRHGDIQSVAPLIRVTRQGPEPWHGRRMVGIVGSVPEKKAKVPEICLSLLRGDIKIEIKKIEEFKTKFLLSHIYIFRYFNIKLYIVASILLICNTQIFIL